MKKILKNILLKVLAARALSMAVFAANIACSAGHCQEKLPSYVKKLRKF